MYCYKIILDLLKVTSFYNSSLGWLIVQSCTALHCTYKMRDIFTLLSALYTWLSWHSLLTGYVA